MNPNDRLQVSRQQVEEWVENPVTIAFKALTEIERDDILNARGIDAFHPFDAQRTQEVLANLNGYADALDRQLAALEGEGLFDESDREEAILE